MHSSTCSPPPSNQSASHQQQRRQQQEQEERGQRRSRLLSDSSRNNPSSTSTSSSSSSRRPLPQPTTINTFKKPYLSTKASTTAAASSLLQRHSSSSTAMLPVPQPTKTFFDPYNSSATGHQRAESRLAGSTSWRESRMNKLSHQWVDTTGRGGEEFVSDLVGAGSEGFGKDGRKENGSWEPGAPGLRESGWQDIRELMGGPKRKREGSQQPSLVEELKQGEGGLSSTMKSSQDERRKQMQPPSTMSNGYEKVTKVSKNERANVDIGPTTRTVKTTTERGGKNGSTPLEKRKRLNDNDDEYDGVDGTGKGDENSEGTKSARRAQKKRIVLLEDHQHDEKDRKCDCGEARLATPTKAGQGRGRGGDTLSEPRADPPGMYSFSCSSFSSCSSSWEIVTVIPGTEHYSSSKSPGYVRAASSSISTTSNCKDGPNIITNDNTNTKKPLSTPGGKREGEGKGKEEPKMPQIFRGLTMYLNGSTMPLVSDHKLKQLFVQHGGNSSITLGRRSVTHVVLGSGFGSKSGFGSGSESSPFYPSSTFSTSTGHNHGVDVFSSSKDKSKAGTSLSSSKHQKEIATVRGKGIKYVTAEWILDSIERGVRQSEARYAPLNLARRIGAGGGDGGSVGGQKSVRTFFHPS